MTSGRSIVVIGSGIKASAANGLRSTRSRRRPKKATTEAAEHDEGEARVPSALRNRRDVKEILDLLRVGHARDGEADAEDDAAMAAVTMAETGRDIRRRAGMTNTVSMAVAMNTPTATNERGDRRARPQTP